MVMAAVRCLLLMVCLLPSAMAAKNRPRSKAYLKLEKLEECPGTSYENRMVSTKTNYSGVGLNGSFLVGQPDVPASITAGFTVKKCNSLEDKACEQVLSGSIDFCQSLLDKGQVYTPFFAAIHPRLKCPIKKGLYIIRNATLDMAAFQTMLRIIPPEFDNYRWALHMKLYSPSKPWKILACSVTSFRRTFKKSV